MIGEELRYFITHNLIFVILATDVGAIFAIYMLYKLLTKRVGLSKTNTVISNLKNAKQAEKDKVKIYLKIKAVVNAVRNFKKKIHLDFSTFEQREEMEYLLKRNKILSLDKRTSMDYFEYDSIITILVILSIIIGLVLCFVFGIYIGIPVMIILIAILLFCPMLYFKDKIKREAEAIQEEFGDYFLNQYHILKGKAKDPLKTGFELYKKITQRKEMKDFLVAAIDLVNTYGEYDAITKIMAIYKDIPSLSRMLRIEKQLMDNSNQESAMKELDGVRVQVMEEKRNYIDKRIAKMKAQAGRWILLIYAILFQSVCGILFIFLMDYQM